MVETSKWINKKSSQIYISFAMDRLLYMDSWERFDATSLPNKRAFYSELYLENITGKDYAHAQKYLKN